MPLQNHHNDKSSKKRRIQIMSLYSKSLAEDLFLLTCNNKVHRHSRLKHGDKTRLLSGLKNLSSNSFSEEELWHTSVVFISFQTDKSEQSYLPEQWLWLLLFLWHLIVVHDFSEAVLCLFQGDELFRYLKTFPGLLSSFTLLFNCFHFW